MRHDLPLRPGGQLVRPAFGSSVLPAAELHQSFVGGRFTMRRPGEQHLEPGDPDRATAAVDERSCTAARRRNWLVSFRQVRA